MFYNKEKPKILQSLPLSKTIKTSLASVQNGLEHGNGVFISKFIVFIYFVVVVDSIWKAY